MSEAEEDIRMSEKVERRTENGSGAGTGAGGGDGGGGGGSGGGGRGAADNNCHEVGAFSVPLISKVRPSQFNITLAKAQLI